MNDTMNEAIGTGWSEIEQTIARGAFDRAYSRAVTRLIVAVQGRSAALGSAAAIWELHDFLSLERHTIEGRFDFRLDGILFVFASLVKEELLDLEELAGLDPGKLAKIAAMARF